MTSPTQRSLAKLKAEGYTAGIVERFNAHVGPHGIRQDFCGGIDLIAFKGPVVKIGTMSMIGICNDIPLTGTLWNRVGGQIVGVQCCGQTGHAAHKAKLLAEPRMREWIAAGGRLVIHSWRKLAVVKKDGKKGKTRKYEVREEEITLSDFPTDPVAEAVNGHAD